jgi:hypothetical protein
MLSALERLRRLPAQLGLFDAPPPPVRAPAQQLELSAPQDVAPAGPATAAPREWVPPASWPAADLPAAPQPEPAPGGDGAELPETGAAFLRRLEALGLRDFDSCHLTRNRNIMVSWRGRVLRINAGYVSAPREVHSAIVAMVQGRTRAARAAARSVVLAHRIPVETVRAPRRREAAHPADAPLVAEMERAHAEYNRTRFGGMLSTPEFRVSRRMKSRLGHYAAAGAEYEAEIAISLRHIRRHGWQEALHTLLHEMVHQWQAETGLPLDHGPEFRRKAREVGIVARATRACS